VLKERFNRDFWMPKHDFYAQALDGSGRQVPSISSNPGHALFCGIVEENKAAKVVERLVAPDMLCGWGVRTLSQHEPHFNPMSYHNGSVWPHDNGIIAAGMRRYGFHKEAAEVIEQVVQAGIRFKLFRLPELYCGFARDLRYYSVPAEYPVSCSPQAWAAGAVLHFCQTLVGASADAARNRIAVQPHLLASMCDVTVERLAVSAQPVTLHIQKTDESAPASVQVEYNPSNVEVVTH
jgi:glycogen debranching enzyme